jgi:hypothetical protein
VNLCSLIPHDNNKEKLAMMKRLALGLFASTAIAIAGCTSSSTTAPTGGGGSSPAASTPPAGDMNSGMPKGSSIMIPTKINLPQDGANVPKLKIPE